MAELNIHVLSSLKEGGKAGGCCRGVPPTMGSNVRSQCWLEKAFQGGREAHSHQNLCVASAEAKM